MFRTITAYFVAPILVIKNKRISKRHRQEETMLYKAVDTILANRIAEAIKPQ